MEKPTIRECCIILVISALVIFAWLCRLINFPWEGGGSQIRSIVYPAIFIYWGFTLHRRLIHTQVRHFTVSIGVLMVFWFTVRTIKYRLPDQFYSVIRYLWYMYYLPMLFIPLLALLTALTIGMPEEQRLPRRYGLLWYPAALLFLLVITNDLHQLVFTFPDNATVWTDKDCSHGIGYFIVYIFLFGCILATFVFMAKKSRRPGSRRWVLFPCIPIFLLQGYHVAYIFQPRWLKFLFGDMTAVSCVLTMVSLELCIRCGMIRSNTGYGELFRAGTLRAQIIDGSNRICLSSVDAAALTEEQMVIVSRHPILVDKTMLLKSKDIRFGRVLWEEDVSELTEAMEEIEENCRDLAERNRIDRENMEAEKTLLGLQEKNRVHDLLSRETAGQIQRIDDVFRWYDSEKDATMRRRILAGAAVLGAYVKRYGNLLLVSERCEAADTADLTRCFEESFINLELLEVNCLCSLPPDVLLKTRDMLRVYCAYEAALEDCLFDLHEVWVNGRERRDQFIINIEFVCDTDLQRHAGEADDYSFDSGAFRFTFRLEKGGAGV